MSTKKHVDDDEPNLFEVFQEANEKHQDRARVRELEKLVRHHRDLYYNEMPQIPDDEFDAYVDELRELDSTNEVLNEVGAPVSANSNWVTGTHNIPMTSLDKVNTAGELLLWAPKMYCEWYSTEEKLDGLSCLDGDTPVLLANGERVPIRDLVEGQVGAEVLTWSPEKGYHTAPITAFHNNGVKDNWVRISFEPDHDKGIHVGLNMMVTEDHLFYVEGKGWVEARSLLEGDDVKETGP